jgi:hypothetical protein
MTGMDFTVEYLTAWAWREARRSADLLGTDPEDGFQVLLDQLHDEVVDALGDDPALEQLEAEAAADLTVPGVRMLTSERVRLALEDAADADPGFAIRVHETVAHLRATIEEPPMTVSVSTCTDRSITIGGH